MKRSHIELIVILTLAGSFLVFLRQVQIGGDTLFMAVYGGSMHPSIKVGDLAIVKHSDLIAEGDIITFNIEGKIVTHRVVDILPEGFVTKGDANNAPALNPVRLNELIGKVVFVVPYAGYVVHYAGTFWGLGFLVWVPAVALIGMEIRNIIKSSRNDSAMPVCGVL